MARAGRPPGADGAATRRRILDAARVEFADRGFDAATVGRIASSAGLATSAVYHYFGGKAELYEQVFDETVDRVWGDLADSISTATDLRDALSSLLDDSRRLGRRRPHHSDFLAMVPVEARRHPRFAPLVDRRAKHQDDAFTAMVDLGVSSGELSPFGRDEAVEILRAVVMGWFFERHFRGREVEGSRDAVLALFDVLAGRR